MGTVSGDGGRTRIGFSTRLSTSSRRRSRIALRCLSSGGERRGERARSPILTKACSTPLASCAVSVPQKGSRGKRPGEDRAALRSCSPPGEWEERAAEESSFWRSVEGSPDERRDFPQESAGNQRRPRLPSCRARRSRAPVPGSGMVERLYTWGLRNRGKEDRRLLGQRARSDGRLAPSVRPLDRLLSPEPIREKPSSWWTIPIDLSRQCWCDRVVGPSRGMVRGPDD